MIRKFESQDLAKVMEIWLEGNLQSHNFINKVYWQKSYKIVSDMILLATVYVYEENGEIVGFLGIQGNYIAGLFVRQDKRSQGIGKSLLDFLKKNFSELNLHVYQKNNQAQKFYLREGFKIIKECCDKDTGEQEYLMLWKNLALIKKRGYRGYKL